MRAEGLAVSVESHSPQFAEALEDARLPYRVYKSSRRWVYLTDYLPSPVAAATARFLQKNVLPELLLDHLDTAYGHLTDEERLAVFQENLDYLQKDDFTLGTQALIQPSLEEAGGLSVDGWLRFRGRAFLDGLIARLALEGLKSLRLERALHQYRSLPKQRLACLVIEGEGDAIRVRDERGQEPFRELLDGYLDPHLKIDREDLAWGLVRTLRPERVDLRGVSAEFRRRVEAILTSR